MQGTLDTFGIVEILQMLARTRRSGTLHIETPRRLIDVHFVHGRIAETRDSTRVDTDMVIGSQLLKRALINEAQLRDALREQESNPRPLGTLLVEQGALDEAALREVLARQVANTLVAAKLETSGTFVFIADRDPRPVDFITIDTQSVLLDISTLGGEYCLAVEVLGHTGNVLVLNRDYDTLPRNPLPMGRDELTVLFQVDGKRTVKEVTRACGLDELTVMSILGKLAEAGVLLVKTDRTAVLGQDRELEAHRESVWAEVSQLLDGLTGDGKAGEAAAAAAAGGPGAVAAGTETAGAGGSGESGEDGLDWSLLEPR
jgi:hypothetical protein